MILLACFSCLSRSAYSLILFTLCLSVGVDIESAPCNRIWTLRRCEIFGIRLGVGLEILGCGGPVADVETGHVAAGVSVTTVGREGWAL